MSPRTWTRAAAAVLAGLTLAACGSSSDEEAGPGPGEIFANSFAPGLGWEFFAGSVNAAGTAAVDTAVGHSGASWKIEVPASGYVGGTVVATTAHDLSTFNALTFWAMASQDATLDVAGFGANQTASVPFLTERGAIALTTTWTKFVIPIPLPAKLTAERGLFHLAEGSEEGAYTIWLDDIRFETLPEAEIGTPEPAIATEARSVAVGATLTVNGASVTYPSPGAAQTLSAGRRFFTWTSSDETAATVDQDGVVTGVAVGTADITAELGAVAATGTTAVTVYDASVPAAAAPTPTPLAADVISLYSNEYTAGATVSFWSASLAGQGWDDGADVQDLQVAGDDVMKFFGLGYSVSEIAAPRVDATGMTHFHVDLWSPTAGATTIKLVDFGADGNYGGGDDVECEASRTLTAGEWNQVDLSFAADLACLTTRAHVAQIVLAGANPTLFVDNVYFVDSTVPPTEPTVAAPTPEPLAADVISLYSNAYTSVTMAFWSPTTADQGWDDGTTVENLTVASDDVMKFSGLGFSVSEVATPIDTETPLLTHFHIDLWSATAGDTKIKLVDYGAGGVYGGGDDVEFELTRTLTAGAWNALDIPLSDFTGLTTRAHVAQLVLSGANPVLFVDNVYFHK